MMPSWIWVNAKPAMRTFLASELLGAVEADVGMADMALAQYTQNIYTRPTSSWPASCAG